MFMGTPSGVLSLSGPKGIPDREYYITKSTNVALGDTSNCPTWAQFLDEVTEGDKNLQRFLQQICGYCLTEETKEHALFFIYGPGGNGKSVFLNTLVNILGNYATPAPMDAFTACKYDSHPTGLAMFQEVRLVAASETEEGRAWKESLVKQLTGGEEIAARFMRQDFFTYKPQFKIIIVGNHEPRLHNVGDDMKRRLNIIPFTYKPKNPDLNLEEKLKAEYPEIFRWMYEGCLDWQKNGLNKPTIVEAATAEYFETQDLFGQWIEENCNLAEGERSGSNILYTDWKDFAGRNGEDPGSTQKFSNNMKKRGFSKCRTRVCSHEVA